MRKHIQTTPGASDVKSALLPIKKALQSSLKPYYYDLPQRGRIYYISKNTMFDDIPPLVHPLVFDSQSNNPYLVMDLRHISGNKSTPVLSEMLRAYLTLEDTIEPESETLYRVEYRFVGVCFVKLVSNLITRTFGLNPDQHLDVEIRVADYYTCMLAEEVSINKRQSFISKLIRVGDKKLASVLNQAPEYTSLRDLCDVLSSADISPKMKRLNPGLLLTIVSGISFGNNIKPIIATSMEYPPYFNYLVYTAIHSIAYKNSLLVKVVEQASKQNRDATAAYIAAVKSLTKEVNHFYNKINK